MGIAVYKRQRRRHETRERERVRGSRHSSSVACNSGTVPWNVAFWATCVAGSFLGVRAVSRYMADARAIVALATLDAVLWDVANSATSIAGLLAEASTTETSGSVVVVTPRARSGLRARTRDMAYLATSIAFGPRCPGPAGKSARGTSRVLRAFARDMAL